MRRYHSIVVAIRTKYPCGLCPRTAVAFNCRRDALHRITRSKTRFSSGYRSFVSDLILSSSTIVDLRFSVSTNCSSSLQYDRYPPICTRNLVAEWPRALPSRKLCISWYELIAAETGTREVQRKSPRHQSSISG